jgi:hypothetical protein
MSKVGLFLRGGGGLSSPNSAAMPPNTLMPLLAGHGPKNIPFTQRDCAYIVRIQPPRFLEVISVVDAKNYIGHAPAIPKLFQSALQDPGVPSKDAEDFFKAATPPKELKRYDSGHDIDGIAALADRARFVAKTLHLGNIERQLQGKNGR